ncbi:MAG: hypothetical protein KBC39_10070 [Thermotogae bacterium]|nr:hypothetical protein [Thermotogota bacterium]HPH12126.1 hypothetical protein [Thermotogota bacterium]HQN23200.1 hypothetical protein [Thermotogota bacterium]
MKKVRIVLLLSMLLLVSFFVSSCSMTVGWPFSWLGGPWAVTFDWGFLLGEGRAPDPDAPAMMNFSEKTITIDGASFVFDYQADSAGNIKIEARGNGGKSLTLTGSISKTERAMSGTDSNGVEWSAWAAE